MKDLDFSFLSKFGEIEFGEENNLMAMDFEKSFMKYFSTKRGPRGRYKFADVSENVHISEFEESFKAYFFL